MQRRLESKEMCPSHLRWEVRLHCLLEQQVSRPYWWASQLAASLLGHLWVVQMASTGLKFTVTVYRKIKIPQCASGNCETLQLLSRWSQKRINTNEMPIILELHMCHLAGWEFLWTICWTFTMTLCGVSAQMCVEVMARWMLHCRMVWNHWYSDSEATNGFVADGVFCQGRKMAAWEHQRHFPYQLCWRAVTFCRSKRFPWHTINYLTPIVY